MFASTIQSNLCNLHKLCIISIYGYVMIVKTFSDWVSKKYLEWRSNKIGRAGTVSAFARMLGVPQAQLVRWMDGSVVPISEKHISAFAAYYGDEVYIALGLPVPPSELDVLPPAYRERMKKAILQSRQMLLDRGLNNDDPAAQELLEDIFKHLGWEKGN